MISSLLTTSANKSCRTTNYHRNDRCWQKLAPFSELCECILRLKSMKQFYERFSVPNHARTSPSHVFLLFRWSIYYLENESRFVLLIWINSSLLCYPEFIWAPLTSLDSTRRLLLLIWKADGRLQHEKLFNNCDNLIFSNVCRMREQFKWERSPAESLCAGRASEESRSSISWFVQFRSGCVKAATERLWQRTWN